MYGKSLLICQVSNRYAINKHLLFCEDLSNTFHIYLFFNVDIKCSPELKRRDSIESTCSEHEFRVKYQTITHRMVHRKSSLEMFKRIASKSFGML